MTNVMENILTRRSVRAFTDQPIEQEKLEQIVKAAVWAPSGQDKQSWHFLMISDTEKIQALATAIREADNRPANYNFYAPTAFLIVAGERDNRHAPLDSGAAIENAMLAAWDLGIGSCWINQLRDQCDTPSVRKLLTEYGLPETHFVWASASLGYPASVPEPHKRAEGTVTYVR